jgi:hypothetical protein
MQIECYLVKITERAALAIGLKITPGSKHQNPINGSSDVVRVSIHYSGKKEPKMNLSTSRTRRILVLLDKYKPVVIGMPQS